MVRNNRGDTIIEVLLAVSVFSLVAVGAIAIMNQGVNTAQRALEITLVKQQIDAQAEALRAAHQAGGTAWSDVKSASESGATIPHDSKSCPSTDALAAANKAFIMNPYTAKLADATTLRSIEAENAPPYAQVVDGPENTIDGAYGLWIERKVDSVSSFREAHDFTVRACWFSAGQTIPVTIQTVVRLYDTNA